MKNLGLFGKSAMRHIRNQRTRPEADARTTSQRIDEIESELSAEFGHTPWLPTETSRPSREALPTLSQCLDEAALLYTNHQIDAAKDLLLGAATAAGDENERLQAWWMLFELALGENQPAFFEKLALDYARTFETSPPQWQPTLAPQSNAGGALPIVNFRGKLCGSSQPALQQLHQAGSRHRQFCLQFGSLPDIDLDGCALLLQVIAQWQSQGCSVHIAGGELLDDALRPLIQRGRRDPDDAGWRLLIELMRLMGRSDDHEALCVDYSLTYDMSPPMALLQPGHPSGQNAPLLLPECIALPVDELLRQMDRHARQCAVLVLDGQRLRRVELSAASPWLAGVHRVAAGKPVECRNLGFLVARLLHLVGGGKQLNIIHRKP